MSSSIRAVPVGRPAVPPPAAPSPQATTVIRPTPLLAGASGMEWGVIIPAWVVSGVLHALFLGGLVYVFLKDPVPVQGRQTVTAINTGVDKDDQDDGTIEDKEDLTNKDLGVNPKIAKGNTSPVLGKMTFNGLPDPTETPGLLNGLPNSTGPQPPPGMDKAFPPKLGGSGRIPGADTANLAPGGFGARGSGATREYMVRTGGGNAESEAAVARALEWLVNHQSEEGFWALDKFHEHGKCDCDAPGHYNNPVAGTAFGVLPFLAAGITPESSGDRQVDYSKNVAKALKYLISIQKEDGAFVLHPKDRTHNTFMYAHGLASIAMCEAASLVPGDPRIQNAARRAVDFIVRSQGTKGGWNYQAGGAGNDNSVSGWQVMALQSGKMAGIPVPGACLEKVGKYLDSVELKDGGGYGYRTPPGSEDDVVKNPTMTAVGLLCRQYLGASPMNESLLKGVERLCDKCPPSPSRKNIYYYYYATQVMHHMGDKYWDQWNPAMRDFLVSTQDKGDKKPHQAGSWPPAGDHFAGAGGRLMMTSLCVLTLEVYYRHLPLYRQELSNK